MDSPETQLSLLKNIESHYNEMSSITEQLLRADVEKRESLLVQRGELVQECQSMFNKLASLPLGASEQDVSEQRELLNESILRAVALNEFATQSLKEEKDKISVELDGAPSRNKAAVTYELHSQFGKKRRDARRTSL